MINPRVCSKCQYGIIEEPIYDKKGDKKTQWSVSCGKSHKYFDELDDILFILSKPPDNCPYLMEHIVSMQNITKEDKKHLRSL